MLGGPWYHEIFSEEVTSKYGYDDDVQQEIGWVADYIDAVRSNNEFLNELQSHCRKLILLLLLLIVSTSTILRSGSKKETPIASRQSFLSGMNFPNSTMMI